MKIPNDTADEILILRI